MSTIHSIKPYGNEIEMMRRLYKDISRNEIGFTHRDLAPRNSLGMENEYLSGVMDRSNRVVIRTIGST